MTFVSETYEDERGPTLTTRRFQDWRARKERLPQPRKYLDDCPTHGVCGHTSRAKRRTKGAMMHLSWERTCDLCTRARNLERRSVEKAYTATPCQKCFLVGPCDCEEA